MTGWNWGGDVDFDKEIDVDIDVVVDLDTDINFDKEYDADIKIYADTDVEGNSATLQVEAEAYGEDTAVEVDAVVLTMEETLSSVYLSVISATDGS